MVRQAIPYLKQYTTVKCYLDNDDAGRTAYAEIASQIGNAIDCSTEYADYKDVNEWLCGRQNKIGHQ
jgi:DNA primase